MTINKKETIKSKELNTSDNYSESANNDSFYVDQSKAALNPNQALQHSRSIQTFFGKVS